MAGICQSTSMRNQEVKATIRAKAVQHGFALCCVTRPQAGRMHADALQGWVDAGMQGDMGWMAEKSRLQRRMNPSSMLTEASSVITLAMRYTPPAYDLAEASAATVRGVVSAYAHGDDYHEVMKKRLKALAADLDALLGKHDQRVFVDTAPVLEHALAESAGLGWQGKHTLTIHRQLGSWFLLGEIFTTAVIEPDAPAVNHCGSCSACIDVCPTAAIIAPYVVDARLCISYLTIEFDGFIPHALRSLMGNRIYGCDDCQLVCPWNEHAGKGAALEDDLLKPRGENHLPDLVSMLQLDEGSFRLHFRKSPVRRTGRRGLLRNVCIAMGNSGDAGFIPHLTAVLADAEPLIRGHAVWAIGQLASQENRADMLDVIVRMNAAEKNDAVREEISLTMQHIRMNDD